MSKPTARCAALAAFALVLLLPAAAAARRATVPGPAVAAPSALPRTSSLHQVTGTNHFGGNTFLLPAGVPGISSAHP